MPIRLVRLRIQLVAIVHLFFHPGPRAWSTSCLRLYGGLTSTCHPILSSARTPPSGIASLSALIACDAYPLIDFNRRPAGYPTSSSTLSPWKVMPLVQHPIADLAPSERKAAVGLGRIAQMLYPEQRVILGWVGRTRCPNVAQHVEERSGRDHLTRSLRVLAMPPRLAASDKYGYRSDKIGEADAVV
jgi:hypothetical protein